MPAEFDWEKLQVFVAAADHMGLSPAMVSRHVQDLEERLGTRLLNRTTRAVTLSHDGARYLETSRRAIAEVPADEWRAVIEVNLTGVFLVAKACIGPLTATRGSMIHLSSGVGDHGRPYWGAYCPAKNGVEALSEMLAGELAEAGVRSNAVDPGAMRTVMRAEAYPDEDPEGVPRPYEISDIFVFLASDESTGVTGQRFRARDFQWPDADEAP